MQGVKPKSGVYADLPEEAQKPTTTVGKTFRATNMVHVIGGKQGVAYSIQT